MAGLRAAATMILALALAGAVVAQAKKPRVPPGRDPGGIAVAVIGSGVNYTLPQLAQRLARDGEGELVGWDFVDEDQRPLEPVSGGASSPSGTAVASIILREARASRLAVVRDKPGDRLAHAKAIVLLSRSPSRIALMTGASATLSEWEPFAQAAAHFSQLLLVVPAGDDGRDIDQSPMYPASLGLANVIVVVGADSTGRPLGSSNRGRAIDVAVAAEGIEANAADGSALALSGSLAAAARVAALAARLQAMEPALAGAALKQRILSFAKPPAGSSAPWPRAGWIAEVQRIH
jgi:hypothetical protein